MTKNRDVKPPHTTMTEEMKQGMNVVEFSKYEEVISASYKVLDSINVRGYALQVGWRDMIFMREDLKDRVTQMAYHTLGKKNNIESTVIEVWCRFLGFKFRMRHYY